MNVRCLIIASTPLLLAGCVNLAGLDGKSKFACAAPDGVSCMSVSGVAENIKAGTFDKPKEAAGGAVDGDFSRAKTPPVKHVEPGMPLRTPPRVVRVWFKDFEDSDEDLISELYAYLTLDTGQWQIDHARRRLAPSVWLRPPVVDPKAAPTPDSPAPQRTPTAAGAIKFPPLPAAPGTAPGQPSVHGEASSAAN